MCFVDLFPWPPPATEQASSSEEQPGRPTSPPAISHQMESGSGTLPSFASIITGLIDHELDLPSIERRAADPSGSRAGASGAWPARPNPGVYTPALGPPPHPSIGIPSIQWQPEPRLPRNHIAAIVDGTPMPELSKCTNAFVGSTFVQGASFHYEGLPSLLFVFPVSASITSRVGGQYSPLPYPL